MRWMWIDQIVEFVPNQKMVAVKNVSLAEEHLHDHFPGAPLMPGSLIIEGMAQTAGILVGSVNRFREKVILAKIALARLDADVTPGQAIRYEATLERMDAAGASTHGLVSRRDPGRADWEPIGEINLMFSHLDQNISGMEFPKENFVFSENFRTILQTAGLAHLAD